MSELEKCPICRGQMQAIPKHLGGWAFMCDNEKCEAENQEIGVTLLHALNRRAPEAGQTLSLDERMREAGMISVADMLAGTPIDKFVAHTGVKDLASFEEWLINCRVSHYRMQAKFELNNMQNDDMYEWYVAHNAVFHEVLVNFRAAKPQAQAEPTCPICNDSGTYCVGTSGTAEDGNAPILERCECMLDKEPAEGQEPVAQLAYGEQGRDPRDGPRLISYNDMPPGTYKLYAQPQRHVDRHEVAYAALSILSAAMGHPALEFGDDKTMGDALVEMAAERLKQPQRPAVPDPDADKELALDLLANLFDKYENGDDCYEDPEEYAGYIGKAFKLDDVTFDACCKLLNTLRPVTAAPAPERPE